MTTEQKSDENITEPMENSAASFITIGQYLKQKRIEKDLSLKTISQHTKIHLALLLALENDEYEKLPNKTYIRGFVKMTSKILGINQEYALNKLEETYIHKNIESPQPPRALQLDETSGIQASAAETDFTKKTKMPSMEHFNALKLFQSSTLLLASKILGLVLILGISGYYINHFIVNSGPSKDIKLPNVVTTHQQRTTSGPKVIISPSPSPTIEAKKEEPLKINLIDEKNQKTDIVINNIKFQTPSIGEKQFVEDKLTKEQFDEYLPAKFRITPTSGTEVVFLNAALGDSWLTYKVGNNDLKKFVLRQGRTLFIRGEVIRLFIGNPSSLKIFHNNKAVALSSNKSSSKNLVFPEDQKTKFMIPLFVFQTDGSAYTSDEFIEASKNGTLKIPSSPPPSPTATPSSVKPSASPSPNPI